MVYKVSPFSNSSKNARKKQRHAEINQLSIFLRQCRKAMTLEFQVHFRSKGLKVLHDIAETSEGNLSNGGLQAQFFHLYHKLQCFIHLNIPFLFSFPQAWNSELQQTMNSSPKINMFLMGYIAATASQTICLL